MRTLSFCGAKRVTWRFVPTVLYVRSFQNHTNTSAMTTTITALPRITASALSSIILAQSSKPDPSLAIIDVRDEGTCWPTLLPTLIPNYNPFQPPMSRIPELGSLSRLVHQGLTNYRLHRRPHPRLYKRPIRHSR